MADIHIQDAAQLHGLLTGPTEDVTLTDAVGEEHVLAALARLGDNESLIGNFIGMDYPLPRVTIVSLPDNYDTDALDKRSMEYNP